MALILGGNKKSVRCKRLGFRERFIGEGDGKHVVVTAIGIKVILMEVANRVSEIHPRRAETMEIGALA